MLRCAALCRLAGGDHAHRHPVQPCCAEQCCAVHRVLFKAAVASHLQPPSLLLPPLLCPAGWCLVCSDEACAPEAGSVLIVFVCRGGPPPACITVPPAWPSGSPVVCSTAADAHVAAGGCGADSFAPALWVMQLPHAMHICNVTLLFCPALPHRFPSSIVRVLLPPANHVSSLVCYQV